MAYRVSLAGSAEMDAYAAFERIREVALCTRRSGLQLYSRPFSAWIRFLPDVRSSPKRKSLAILSAILLYGKGKGVYRIIFHIREDEQHVRVLRVWHASREAITATDVVD